MYQYRKIDIPYNLKVNIIYSDFDNCKDGNCYKFIEEAVNKNLQDDERVAVGYVRDEIGCFMRHCWVVDTNGKVLDPINATEENYYKHGNFLTYYAIKEMTKEEYLKYRSEYENKTNKEIYDSIYFKKALFKEELELIQIIYTYENRFISNYNDYIYFLRDIFIHLFDTKGIEILDILFEINKSKVVTVWNREEEGTY